MVEAVYAPLFRYFELIGPAAAQQSVDCRSPIQQCEDRLGVNDKYGLYTVVWMGQGGDPPRRVQECRRFSSQTQALDFVRP